MSDLEQLLPQGRAEFDPWAERIIKASGLPDNDSVRFALAVNITHLGPTVSRKNDQYFVDVLQKAAATQVAFAVMDELKAKQKAASEAASQPKPSEATESSVENVQGSQEITS